MYDAFLRMLPARREQHPGDYVGVCGGEVIARGMFFDVVFREGMTRAGGRAVYVGFLNPPDYGIHIGGLEVIYSTSSGSPSTARTE